MPVSCPVLVYLSVLHTVWVMNMKGSFGAMDGVAVLWLRGCWIELCCVVSLSLPSWELHSFKLNSCCGCCISYNFLTNAANCCDNLVLKILKTLILRLHAAISKPWFMDRTGLLLVHAHVIKFECWHLQVTLGCLRLLSCFILLWSVWFGNVFSDFFSWCQQ